VRPSDDSCWIEIDKLAIFVYIVLKLIALANDRSCKRGGEAVSGTMMDVQTTTAEAILSTASADRAVEVNWYALYTCPRHEKRVAEQIEQRHISCFLPLYRSIRRWKDRRKELDLALFPGYVFVRITPQDRLRVLQLAGAVRFVSFNGQPVPLPASEMESLMSGLSSGVRAEPHPYLTVGRSVRVRSGPLAGAQGILIRRKDKFRVVLSLELIMRSVAVEVDESDIEPC
jgi:transcription antitermination factor NusG